MQTTMKRWFVWFTNIVLLKTITSREGIVHFRRWGILTRWFNVYVHHIAKSDEDVDPHDHPWWYMSFVLWGGYSEMLYRNSENVIAYIYHGPRSIVVRKTTDFHKLTLVNGPAWTFVITGPRTHDLWGYSTRDGWVDHLTYRRNKHK